MRTIIRAGIAGAALAGVAAPASAEETTVVRQDSGPAVSVEHRDGVVERAEMTTSTVVRADDHPQGC